MFRRKLIGVLAVVLSLVVTATTAGVAFAQEDTGVTPGYPALSIRAPQAVSVGEPVNMAVTDSGVAVAGAEVWALRWPGVRPLATDAPSTEAYPASPPHWQYQFLGTTNEAGELVPPPVLENAGRFLIVATHNGYAPGFHIIMVKARALAIDAPEAATVGEPVTIMVTDRGDGEPVAGAKVYARHGSVQRVIMPSDRPQQQQILERVRLKVKQTRGNRPVLASRPLALPVEEDGASLEDSVAKLGEELGETNSDGEIIATFEDPGRYRIVAILDGYFPGTAGMVVRPENELNALAVKGPRFAKLDEEVTFTVLERGDSLAVAEAEVYALSLPLRQGVTGEEKPFWFEPPAEGEPGASLKAMAIENGEHLGVTDENGQVSYVFSERGRYLIVATKEGYLPCITHITVGNHRIVALPNPGMEDNGQARFRLKPSWSMP